MKCQLWIILIVVVVWLPGCISLGEDDRLTEMAQEEWLRSGPPERWRDIPIRSVVTVGIPLPGVASGEGYVTAFVPWPFNHCEFIARGMMRYELSKGAYQSYGINENSECTWYYPYLWADGLLHLPPSELHSWYRVFFPGEFQRR